MVTLAVFKSTSGTIKKMLHGPTLNIYCVKEVPLANREIRKILKAWIGIWERLGKQKPDKMIKITSSMKETKFFKNASTSGS